MVADDDDKITLLSPFNSRLYLTHQQYIKLKLGILNNLGIQCFVHCALRVFFYYNTHIITFASHAGKK